MALEPTWRWGWLGRRRNRNSHLNGAPLHIGGADTLFQLAHYTQETAVIQLAESSHVTVVAMDTNNDVAGKDS